MNKKENNVMSNIDSNANKQKYEERIKIEKIYTLYIDFTIIT